MACQFRLASSLSSSSSHFLNADSKPKPCRRTSNFRLCPSITAQSTTPATVDSDDGGKAKGKTRLDFLKLSATLTVISASLIRPNEAVAAAKERKRSGAKKKAEASMSPEELKSWSQGLPTVENRIPYSSLLELKESGKVKHVIKPPGVELKAKSEAVLVVLEDSRVGRTVLPSAESDAGFWERWGSVGMEAACVNAYTPAVKWPEVPRPYLGFMGRVPEVMSSVLRRKKESEKAGELRRAREEYRRRRREEAARMRAESEVMESAMRRQRRDVERRARQRKQQASRLEARQNAEDMGDLWDRLAADQNVATALGLLFFYLFYRTVVLSYRKQKRDYEDRLKIQKAEADERRKMRDLERQMTSDGVAQEGDNEDNNPYMKMAAQFMKSGARVRNRRLPQYLETDVDVKFEDVAGLGKIRLELEEIVKFFTHAEMYRRRGVKIPGGILLCGPPGVGKTLLAKAVAGEAGVNFFSISASQFVEIYVGVGASRVRALYQEARENAPSVVFIDELDAVGRERGLIKGSGGQERDATLNQLLVSLDGFEGRGEVITIASTNRPDILDPALVRPGRFDRKIFIPKPGVIGRVEILKVHARKKPMAEDVDYLAVASMTDGMVGAELANIVEVAAINMIRDARTVITTDDLIQAAQMEERGMLDRKDRSFETWKRIAINEAAVAVASINFPDLKNVEFLTIAPRAGRELGYVRMKMDPVRFNEGMLTRQSVLDHITVQLAPRAADGIYFGEDQLSTIWAETADNARSAARTCVLGGLSDKHHGLSNFWVADRINDLDSQALGIVNTCYERAKGILNRNRKLMDAVVGELVEKKSLSKHDFLRLVDQHGCLEPTPPSVLDLRAAKRKQLQEMLTKQTDIAKV